MIKDSAVNDQKRLWHAAGSDKAIRLAGRRGRWVRWPVLCCASLLLAGCAGLRDRGPEAGPLRFAGYRPVVGDPLATGVGNGRETVDLAQPRDRLLRNGDPVRIVLRGPEQTEIQDVLDENGMVNLPNVGRVQLSGLTTSQAEDAVERAYIDGGIYLRLTVNVLSQTHARRDSFFVYGEARGPGRYDYVEGMTLLQAVTTAGGLTDDANPRRVYIRRGGRLIRHNIRPMLRGDAEDVLLQPGDVITIRARWF